MKFLKNEERKSRDTVHLKIVQSAMLRIETIWIRIRLLKPVEPLSGSATLAQAEALIASYWSETNAHDRRV
jgi:hypothetical protein